MSLNLTPHLVREARKEGMNLAAELVERLSDRLMREAEKAHDEDEPNYDLYEDLESRASLLSDAADKIRRKAKRLPR